LIGKKIKFIFLNAEEGFFIIEAVQGAAGKLVIILSLGMTREMKKNRKTPFSLRKNGASEWD
jgi:hypothetical protein